MAKIVLGYDAADAAARRQAAMPRHLAALRPPHAAGVFRFAAPLLAAPGGAPNGSLLVLTDAGLAPYLAAEPFITEGVWSRHEVLEFAPADGLGFRPLPEPGAAPVAATAVVAMDGDDAGAGARRLAARPKHFARVADDARAGRLILGGAILDGGGAMVGSLAILAMPTPEAFAWVAADPYVAGDVWRCIAMHPTVLAPLPPET